MDRQQQQQQIEKAAQQFTDALVSSFRTLSERTVGSQEQGTRLTEEFFNRVINNLRTQAQNTREMTQRLADQQQRVVQAGQTLTQGAVGAYMDFLNSMFSYSRGGVEAAQRGSERAAGASGTSAEAQKGEGRKRYTMSVASLTELSATSTESFEDAIQQAIGRATKTLRGVEGAWVKDRNVLIEDGQIKGYKVNLLVTFILEDSS